MTLEELFKILGLFMFGYILGRIHEFMIARRLSKPVRNRK